MNQMATDDRMGLMHQQNVEARLLYGLIFYIWKERTGYKSYVISRYPF